MLETSVEGLSVAGDILRSVGSDRLVRAARDFCPGRGERACGHLDIAILF